MKLPARIREEAKGDLSDAANLRSLGSALAVTLGLALAQALGAAWGQVRSGSAWFGVRFVPFPRQCLLVAHRDVHGRT